MSSCTLSHLLSTTVTPLSVIPLSVTVISMTDINIKCITDSMNRVSECRISNKS